MTIILGIDPGSIITGYGLIEDHTNNYKFIEAGPIYMDKKSDVPILQQIYRGIAEVIKQFQPEEVAVEQVFMAKNAGSALKLGQARGAAIVAATQNGEILAEYSPREIKQAIVGFGGAAKEQVQFMVTRLLSLPEAPQADAADALAVAICHAHSRKIKGRWK